MTNICSASMAPTPPVLYAAAAAVAEFGERPTPNAASAAANSRLTIEITPLEASKQQAPRSWSQRRPGSAQTGADRAQRSSMRQPPQSALPVRAVESAVRGQRTQIVLRGAETVRPAAQTVRRAFLRRLAACSSRRVAASYRLAVQPSLRAT